MKTGISWSEEVPMDLDLQGEVSLDLTYGGDFTLKKGTVVGKGTQEITQGFKYDLIERILLQGTIGERLFVEFNYDSERTEEGIAEEQNIYSVLYKGKEDEFLKEASLGNKYLSIDDTRYIPIDEGSQDSFALRGVAGWDRLYMEGILRYNVALKGEKHFQGHKKSVDMKALDVDYAKGRFFLLPDKDIDEDTLRLYRSSTAGYDRIIDGKKFRLLERGADYSFDNTTGKAYMNETLGQNQELSVYYEKGGDSVGSSSLGQDAIIDESGSRKDFNNTAFTSYFDDTNKYLYLKKKAFNSYWEMRNAYFLEELEGNPLNVEIELLYTANSGINPNYQNLLDHYRIDGQRGAIFFQFEDDTGKFYPRPFPGEEPFELSSYSGPSDPANPFSPQNPIYGGISYPEPQDSINTLHITYTYYAESFFLDFDVVPGSVEVVVDGRVIDPADYTVDYNFGIITFEQGVISPSSDVDITYRYSPYGGAQKSLFSALGLTFDNDYFKVHTLTGFDTAIKGQQAPEVGAEGPASLKNSTEVSLNLGADEDQEGGYVSLNAEAAFSRTDPNVYGSAVIADMEKGEYIYQLGLVDQDWNLATKSSIILTPPDLLSRGRVMYRNYWRSDPITGDTLQTLSWDLPSDHIFDYSSKPGPYNTADKPTGGNDTSLVIDYRFDQGEAGSYVTVVKPVSGRDFSGYQRFNVLYEAQDIQGSDVQVYVEVLKSYNEDLDDDGELDGENSINDTGYSITPEDGTTTVLGTSREGKSDGEIDSEDLNGNGLLDTTEEGLVIPRNGNNYMLKITGSTSWQYRSTGILDLIDANSEKLQYVEAVRITVVPDSTSSDSSGKIVINKLWFSGSTMVNNSSDYLNISEVSVYEDPEVKENAFSKTYPEIYSHLHGDPTYRARNEYEEKVLKVIFTPPLASDNKASVSRRFGFPEDLSFYKTYRMFVFFPSGSWPLPANTGFVLRIITSSSQLLEATLPADGSFRQGWNKIEVDLEPPYRVTVNSSGEYTMTKTGELLILKRVTEIEFGIKAAGGDISQGFEMWLDEWYTAGTRKYQDKALYTEGRVGYRGSMVSAGGFSLLGDSSATVGYERKEGAFMEQMDYKSDTYFARFSSTLVKYLEGRFSVSKEYIEQFRNQEDLPVQMDTGGTAESLSLGMVIDFNNEYIPVVQHSYNRSVENLSSIELTRDDYMHKDLAQYNESVLLSEHQQLPSGISHSYSFSRSWGYTHTQLRYPATDSFSERDSAYLDQVHSLELSYSWMNNYTSVEAQREETYTGDYVPYSGTWPRSYTHKLGTIFSPAGQSLHNAIISFRSDLLELGVNLPMEDNIGFSFSVSTAFNESGFVFDETGYRDTVSTSSMGLSVPFRMFGSSDVRVIPSMERKMHTDYQRALTSETESEILLSTYSHLFMSPFYYINPIPGLGRIKDYQAVDIYKHTDQILGNTENLLYNKYALECNLGYKVWYVPDLVSIALSGETRREGGNYLQQRQMEASVSKSIFLSSGRKYSDRNLSLMFDYSLGKDYSTKVLSNSFEITTGLALLKSPYRGIKLDHCFSYTREVQKIGEEGFLLFPGQPERETAVSEKPDKDIFINEITFSYLWEKDLGSLGGWFVDKNLLSNKNIHNQESVTLYNEYTFTERQNVTGFSNIPFRVALEHNSSL
ncbi:MAG: hypothetical protein ACOC7U_04425, partial [Spirochaetota bacterium]